MIHTEKRGVGFAGRLRRAVVTVMMAAFIMTSVSAFLPDASAYETQYGTVINVTSVLNVRSGPGTENNVLGALYSGNKVTIVDEGADSKGELWYKIEYGTGYGFIHSNYVKIYTPPTVGGDVTDEEFRAQLVEQEFPESYIEKLMELHAAYPNWVFKAMHTGYKWDYAIAMEYRVPYSLVENSFPSSWKSTQPGAYDWETGTWIPKDGTRWVCASEEIIKYFMDPRNFLDPSAGAVFQFLDQSYDENVQTVEGVQALLNGSFMEGVLPDDTSKTFAEVIFEAAKSNGLNPYVIASMLLTEQGKNGSSLSDGKYPGYEGYYNFFNIEANGADPVARGLAYAKKMGWDTRTKSINAGTAFYATSYFKAGKTTLYLKKFNVQGSTPFEYQYMASIYGAKVEGEVMARGYTEEVRQAALTFLIPIYEDMPSTPCAQPTGDGSPNIKLKSLSVEGFELTPDFQPDIMEYSLVVPNETASVNIEAKTMDSKATLTGGGTLTLENTVNKFTVRVTAENQDTRDYIITVAKEAPGIEGVEFTGNYNTSGVNIIIGPDVPVSTVVSGLLSKGKVIITTNDGSSKEEGVVVCTGDKLFLYNENDESVAIYTAAVKGDVNGDGTISGSDFIKIRNHILGSAILKDENFTAADINADGAVSGSDFIKVRNHILKTNLIA